MTPDRFTTGTHGYFEFKLHKKWERKPKSFNGDQPDIGFRLHATIIENDDGHILIEDNDGMLYIVRKKDVRVFEKGIRESEKDAESI